MLDPEATTITGFRVSQMFGEQCAIADENEPQPWMTIQAFQRGRHYDPRPDVTAHRVERDRRRITH